MEFGPRLSLASVTSALSLLQVTWLVRSRVVPSEKVARAFRKLEPNRASGRWHDSRTSHRLP